VKPDGSSAREIPPGPAEKAREAILKVFHRAPAGVAVAPGRVNLIGEHTDYNEGFVLPMAIDRYVAAAFAPNGSPWLRVHSAAFGEVREVSLERIPGPTGTWIDYVAGVAWALNEAGRPVAGIDIAIASDLPVSSGLSSSAALELATARALIAVAGGDWGAVTAARLCQHAENGYVGVQCGIMDQLVVALARNGCALLIDCRDLSTTAVPIPSSVRLVVMDTGAPRNLAVSGYNERRASCEAAVETIRGTTPRVRTLRDVDGRILEAAREFLDPVTFKRAQHVVAESARPADLAQALCDQDLGRCGRLMSDSHWSLRDLYQVSSEELDVMTQLAANYPACHGARMTGAGFGGCAIALVAAEHAEAFAASVRSGYGHLKDLPATLHVCRPVSGVALW
jgi:galactokinase